MKTKIRRNNVFGKGWVYEAAKHFNCTVMTCYNRLHAIDAELIAWGNNRLIKLNKEKEENKKILDDLLNNF